MTSLAEKQKQRDAKRIADIQNIYASRHSGGKKRSKRKTRRRSRKTRRRSRKSVKRRRSSKHGGAKTGRRFGKPSKRRSQPVWK